MIRVRYSTPNPPYPALLRVVAVPLVVAFVALTACGRPDRDEAAGPDRLVTAADGIFAAAADRQPFATPAGSVLLDSAPVALGGPRGGDRVELYVQAERLPNGDVLWEDGHRWFLYVRDGEEAFPLLSAFVPHGVVRFRIVDRFEPAPAIVVTIDSSTSGIHVAEFAYEAAGDRYVRGSLLRVEGRVLHRTPESAFD